MCIGAFMCVCGGGGVRNAHVCFVRVLCVCTVCVHASVWTCMYVLVCVLVGVSVRVRLRVHLPISRKCMWLSACVCEGVCA